MYYITGERDTVILLPEVWLRKLGYSEKDTNPLLVWVGDSL